MVDAVHAGYIAGLSLIRISSTDARLAPGFMVQVYTEWSTVHLYSDISRQSRVCALQIKTKMLRLIQFCLDQKKSEKQVPIISFAGILIRPKYKI